MSNENQLVVKKTETEPNLILNGRAALCAGRDDMSSEDESESVDDQNQHRFKKPDNFKTILESGAIPDAAMIHEARKKRQKARELGKPNNSLNQKWFRLKYVQTNLTFYGHLKGDFVAIEEKPVDNRKGRLIREEAEDDASEDERVDMSAITGSKELEERREKFYSVQGHGKFTISTSTLFRTNQNDNFDCNLGSDEDSDMDMHEWESQQIRKAISGSQLINAQQEAYAHFLIKDGSNDSMNAAAQISTRNRLEQAYASSKIQKSISQKSSQKTEKKSGPRMPHEILNMVKERLKQVKESNDTHLEQIQKITNDMNVITLEELECEQNAPIVAAKFRFYQELKGYVLDLIECFDEKLPKTNELERKYMAAVIKYANFLIERRRQDVRDQAREVTQTQSKCDR